LFLPLSPLKEMSAFAVHILTAAGAALALAALMSAVAAQWTAMFVYLGLALIIDGVDGSLARLVRVREVLPRWSGDVLDLIVDFVTYVFVPAYAIAAGSLMPPALGLLAGILVVITAAIYFADRDMKFLDNYFRGFPALWNVVAFYLFVLRPEPWLAFAIVVAFAVLTFIPLRFLHPVRVVRHRVLNLMVLALWSLLAIISLVSQLAPGTWIKIGLLCAAAYFCGVGLFDRARYGAPRLDRGP
jgi:phosphatidylcholine synthase